MRKITTILTLLLTCTACDDFNSSRLKEVDGHVYLRRDGSYELFHDPNCGRCKEIEDEISREHTIVKSE